MGVEPVATVTISNRSGAALTVTFGEVRAIYPHHQGTSPTDLGHVYEQGGATTVYLDPEADGIHFFEKSVLKCTIDAGGDTIANWTLECNAASWLSDFQVSPVVEPPVVVECARSGDTFVVTATPGGQT